MKQKTIFTSIIALALSSQLVSAGSITDTYVSGDTLTATILENIKAAVNDNDATKQVRITGTCLIGELISAVNADGTVSCDPVTMPVATYSEYYSGSSFERVTSGSTIENNIRRHSYQAFAWADVAGTQYLNYSLSLPNNSTVTDLTCYYYDDDAAIDILDINQRILFNKDPSSGELGQFDNFYHDSSTSGQSKLVHSVSSPADSLTIDNANNAYRIYIYDSNFGGSSVIRFYGCKVTYQK